MKGALFYELPTISTMAEAKEDFGRQFRNVWGIFSYLEKRANCGSAEGDAKVI